MAKNKKPGKAQRVAAASLRKSSNSAAPHGLGGQGGASKPAAPKSIEDVARLFIGTSDTGGSDPVADTHAVAAKGSIKRSREQAGALSTDKKNAPLKKRKTGTVQLEKASPPRRTAAAAAAVAKQEENEDSEDDEEDAELSKAVQARTLSFLQHLSSQNSKAFWGLRDVAQGKRSAPVAAAPAASSSGKSSTSATTAAGSSVKKGKQKGRVLADDGEELWRVGGPYIPSDDDVDGRVGGSAAARGGAGSSDRSNSDGGSQDSDTSSEPSWVTDSDDEEDGGEASASSATDQSEDDDGDAVSAVLHNARGSQQRQRPQARRGGGGRLFQGGGDDVWDEDE